MKELTFEHAWIRHGTGFNDHDKPGRWIVYPDTNETPELWTFLQIDLEYDRDQVASCLDLVEGCVSGNHEPGEIFGGNDGGLFYGDGHVLIASDYNDDARMVMTAEQFSRVLRHVLETMDHPDYRNPDAVNPFGPLTVAVIAEGEDSLQEYYKLGGITPIMPEEYS